MKTQQKRRLLRRTCLVLLILALMGITASWFVAGALIAPHPSSIGPAPSDLPAETISLPSKSGSQIAGWHLMAKDPKGVLVLLHPIRGSRLSMLPRARLFLAAGYSIVMIDLQAHGESKGPCITMGMREKFDARAAVNFAKTTYPKLQVGVVGCSLGGAAALLAAPLPIDALVLEAVFPNIEDAVHNRVRERLGPFASIPAQLLLAWLEPRTGAKTALLRPIDQLPKLTCPIFVLGGKKDAHTPPAETRNMFQSAGGPKELWLVDEAAHVDLYSAAPQEYEARVLSFLKRHLRK